MREIILNLMKFLINNSKDIIILTCLVLLIFFIKSALKEDAKESPKKTHSIKKTSEDIGLELELKLIKALDSLPFYKQILHDIWVRRPNNKLCQIDIVVLCCFGIFVIEAKNRAGKIIGDTEDWKWIQTIQNIKVDTFYNPIKQNANHIKYLKEFIGGNYRFYSYIVFGEKATLVNKINVPTYTRIFKEDILAHSILSDISKKAKTLTESDIYNIYLTLKRHSDSIPSWEKKLHYKYADSLQKKQDYISIN